MNDCKGFYGFSERHGIDVEVLVSGAEIFEDTSPEYAIIQSMYTESLSQEWLWFGVLHESPIAYGLDNNSLFANFSFIRRGSPDAYSDSVANTEALLDMVRAPIVRMLQQQEVPLDLKPGDWVYIKNPIDPNLKGLLAGPFQVVEDLGNMLCNIDIGGGELLRWFATHLKLAKSHGTTSKCFAEPEGFEIHTVESAV